MAAPVYYESWAGIWVERPTYLNYDNGWDRYTPPAQIQASRLTEQLHTRTFLMDVAKRTPLAPLIGSAAGEQVINEIFWKSFVAIPSGRSLLVLRVRADSPDLAFALVTAVVDAFRDKVSTDGAEQADLATSFYQ